MTNSRILQEREDMQALLALCLEYLEDRSDVEDGPDGQPRPNEAMRLATEIKYVLGVEP
jgi:hypothetical protein